MTAPRPDDEQHRGEAANAIEQHPSDRTSGAATGSVDREGGPGVDRLTERDRRASELDILRLRILAALVIGAAVMLMPLFGTYRIQIGAAVILIGIVSNLVLIRRVERGDRVPSAIAIGDAITACAVAFLVPETYGVAVIVLVSCTGLYVFWFGRRRMLPIAVPTGIALAIIGHGHDAPSWRVYFVAWSVTTLFSTIIFGRLEETLTAQRDRYDGLVNGIDAAVWEGSGPSGPPNYVSERAAGVLGYDISQIRDAEFFRSRIHPDDLAAFNESRRLVSTGQDVEVHFRVTDANGRVRRVQDRVRVTVDGSGRVARRRGVLVDETARWEAEASARRYTDFIEGIPIALLVLHMTDPEDPTSFVVQAANPAALAITSLDDGAIGHRIVDLISVTDVFLADMARVVSDGVPHDRPVIQIEGSDEIFAFHAVPLPDRCIGISLEDVTKRARTAEAFRHQATHDTLTGLANRALLNERLTQALGEADRTGAPVGLLVVDLDQFKDVNDALGHEYGDSLLRELATRMSTRLRDCDTIARLGGDEFAVLLTTDAAVAGAENVARRLTELAREPVKVGQYRLQVGASVGIAVAPDHGDDAETLMRHADAAMYDAKQSGCGHVVYSPRHELGALRRLELLADLREGDISADVEVHYQPRIHLATMSPVGVEALVRWRHPVHGLLAPSDFIELAEVSGSIRSLTQAVTMHAFGVLDVLADHGVLSTSVNLSSRNLYDPSWVEWICELAGSAPIPAGTLWLELTEEQLMDDPRQSSEVIRRLHDLGIRFSVDDFGQGSSSITVLRDMPIDELKIAPQFVADLMRGDERVVRSIIDTGHHLGLAVTAEGVADERAVTRLRALGCDIAQGFALGPPLPLDELLESLRTGPPGKLPVNSATGATGPPA